MKITIGGITIEGTPKELAEYERLVDAQEQRYYLPFRYPNDSGTTPQTNPLEANKIICGDTPTSYVWSGPGKIATF